MIYKSGHHISGYELRKVILFTFFRLPTWKVMRRDVSTYTYALSGCWFLPLKVYPIISFFHSFFLPFSFYFFLYGATCQCSPQPHHFQDLHNLFIDLVHRHLIALLAWQDNTNREGNVHIGAPGRDSDSWSQCLHGRRQCAP